MNRDKPVALWAVPRSISTAFERVFVERDDFEVLHEPFSYAYYYGPDRPNDRFAHRAADRCTSVPFHQTAISPIFGSVSNNSEGGDPVSHCHKPQQAHRTWISVRGGLVD